MMGLTISSKPLKPSNSTLCVVLETGLNSAINDVTQIGMTSLMNVPLTDFVVFAGSLLRYTCSSLRPPFCCSSRSPTSRPGRPELAPFIGQEPDPGVEPVQALTRDREW